VSDIEAAVVAVIAACVVLLAVGLRVLAFGVVPTDRKPSSASAWLLLIMFQPVLGWLAFRLFGSTRLGRRRHARHAEANAWIAERTAALPRPLDDVSVPEYVRSAARLNRRLGALPVTRGNAAELLSDYQGSIDAMAAAVDEAREYVHVEFYITAWDEVTAPLFDAMVRAAERGVPVRLLFDHLGSRGLDGYQDMLRRLDGTGIQWRAMLPVEPFKGHWRRPDLRNHRKILVADGLVGFTGSQNLTEPSYHKPAHHEAGRRWVELMVRLEGPVVAALDTVFLGDWYVETGDRVAPREQAPRPRDDGGVLAQVLPSGPGFASENNLRMFTTLVYGARERLSLTSPYFVPDESLLYAVTSAAQRGVATELFVSEQSDQFMVGHAQASYYRVLLEAGVRIFLYPAPLVLHSKHMTVDDDVAVIGSSNMDMRSFVLNYEVSTMMTGGDVVSRMHAVEDEYRRLSRELTLEEWSERPGRTRYVDNVMRLTAALQ
jgi:cardiolipin synthase